MISKERLQKLIEQGATIYEAKYHNINPVNLSQKIRCVNYRYGMVAFEPSPKEKYLHHKYLKNLFETKEEAEWHLKFGNITRTETLSLPSWEELKQKINSNGYGNKTIANFDNYIFEYKRTKTQVVLGINLGCETLFYGVLTLANYTDACEQAKKLFLGEVEE